MNNRGEALRASILILHFNEFYTFCFISYTRKLKCKYSLKCNIAKARKNHIKQLSMAAYASSFISNCSLFRRHSSELAQELDDLRRRLNETTERLQNEKGETDEIGERARAIIEECDDLRRQIEELEAESGRRKARTHLNSPEPLSLMSPVSVPVSPRHSDGGHQPHQLAPDSPERVEAAETSPQCPRSPNTPSDNPYCPHHPHNRYGYGEYNGYDCYPDPILDSDEEEIYHNMPDCPDCGSKIAGVTCWSCQDAYDHYYNNYNPRSSSPATTDCSGDPICHSDTDSD